MYRIKNPFKRLAELGEQVSFVDQTNLRHVNIDDWDLFVLPRLGLESLRDTKDFMDGLHALGKKIVYEIDDDLVDIPEWNPSHNELTPSMVESISEMIRLSDAVTVSTPHLGRRMRVFNPNIFVLPNCIDPDFWTFDYKKTRKVEGLSIGVHGGNSHVKDWEVLAEVFPVIAEKYPEVTFVVAGFHPPYFEDLHLGDRLFRIGWSPLEHYPAAVSQIDIGLCPLLDDVFNRSKSPIKYMEHAMCGAPVVASPTVYGNAILHGKTGLLARNTEDWIKYISRLIEKPRLRREIGAAARGEVLRHLNIQETATRWMQVYKTVWTKA